MSKTPSSSRGIQSVEVGCKLLRALVQSGQPMMLRDLASSADLAPAQAHAYLVSFRRTNLVEQDPASGTYSIGPFSMRLALSRMMSVEPLASATRAATQMCGELGLMVALVVWGLSAPTVVYVQEGAHTLNVNLRTGTMFPVTGSAIGYVFAAFDRSDAVQGRIDDELGGKVQDTLPIPEMGRRDYARIVASVRKAGYATTTDLPVPGVSAIAAPVFEADGRLVLAMTLIGPKNVVDLSEGGATVSALLARCGQLSAAA